MHGALSAFFFAAQKEWRTLVAVILAVLLVAAVLLYQYLHRRHGCGAGTATPSRTANPGVAAALLPLKKWDTIQSMMLWRSEMSSLDGIIQSLEPAAPAVARTAGGGGLPDWWPPPASPSSSRASSRTTSRSSSPTSSRDSADPSQQGDR